MQYLTRRDGSAFIVDPPLIEKNFKSMIEEAVALSKATGLYVVIDVGGCRVVVDRNTNPTRVTTEWWNNQRMGHGNHIGSSYNDAYTANDHIRASRLSTAPAMAVVDAAEWERLKASNYASRFDLAERWARLMQMRMGSSRRLTDDIAQIALYEADTSGSVQTVEPAVNYRRVVLNALNVHWEHGGQLRKLFK